MTFLTIIVWAGVMWFLYNRFYNELDVGLVTFEDEEGNEFTEERPALNRACMVQVIIAIAWTAFSFWLLGKQMINYMYYY